MNANELRIGNYVIDSKDYKLLLLSISQKGNCSGYFPELNDYGTEEINLLKPIPLTEEWLMKFRFEKRGGCYFSDIPYKNDCWINFSFVIAIWDDGRLFYDWNGGNSQLNYVHQLQNLYFALTGEELTL